METTHHKNFFERYQLFFAIIISGILIAGGIIVSKFVQPGSGSSNETGQQASTQAEVRDQLMSVAKKIGINKNKFAACLDNGTFTQKITDDVQLAQKSGVSGTPTFFIIKRTFGANDTITSEKQFMILGARDQATFEKSIADGKSPIDQPAQPKGEKIVLSETDHWQGPKNAEVVIVEYSDMDCPFCKRAKPILDQLLKDNPEYAFVYRHSPIASLHPFAEYKAAGAECAAQLGGDEAFWKYRDHVEK